MGLEKITLELRAKVKDLHFGPPVTHVYRPLEYAWLSHRRYLRRFGGRPREILLLGMNPGPWGMVQTGIPFGDVERVRDWLGIEARVERPLPEHPRRPVEGFACRRREVSGRRLWGWARDRFGTPERFFTRFFVANYCPLCFLEESGRNRTPDRLPARERGVLFDVCDEALRRVTEFLAPSVVVGVGGFARRRAREALDGLGVRIGLAPHPSPASPRANQGWSAQMDAALAALDIRSED
jgi:single-strand selective monofunctional uracil DNA glycosylase